MGVLMSKHDAAGFSFHVGDLGQCFIQCEKGQ